MGKLVSRSDANTSLSESFEYDTLNRLTKSILSLSPTPLVATFSYNAIGNLTFKSDVGAYSYPAPASRGRTAWCRWRATPSTPPSPRPSPYGIHTSVVLRSRLHATVMVGKRASQGPPPLDGCMDRRDG